MVVVVVGGVGVGRGHPVPPPLPSCILKKCVIPIQHDEKIENLHKDYVRIFTVSRSSAQL